MDTLQELPGLYEISGIDMEVRVPRTAEKTVTRVPLSHIAYNIILPRVGKRIDPDNFRRKISDYIRSVESYEGKNAMKFPDGTIRVPSDLEMYDFAYRIGSELGHAFSDSILVPDVYTPLNSIMWEYYDFLGKMIAKEEFSGTKFGFVIPSLRSAYHRNFLAVKHARYITAEMKALKKRKFSKPEHIETARKKIAGIDRRLRKIEKTLEEKDYEHFVGYHLGEIIGNAVGYEKAFTDHMDIFEIKEKDGCESLTIKYDIIKKVPSRDLKKLWKVLEICTEYTTLHIDQDIFILGTREDLCNYDKILKEKESRIRLKSPNPTCLSGS